MQSEDGVQQHDAVGGQRVIGEREEVVVAVKAEMLERTDGHDPVDGSRPWSENAQAAN